MITCSRKLHFSAGHRLLNHEGGCRHIHGHNYTVIVHARAPHGLDSVGRVIDFSAIKSAIGGWIDQNWDHGFLLCKDDPIKDTLLADGTPVFEFDENPTAEVIARFLLKLSDTLLPQDVSVFRVEVQETENCSAEASR